MVKRLDLHLRRPVWLRDKFLGLTNKMSHATNNGTAPSVGALLELRAHVERWLWRRVRKYRLTRAAKSHFAKFEELRDQWKLCVGWAAGGSAMPGWTALTEQQHPEVMALRTTAEAHYRAGMKIYRLLFPNNTVTGAAQPRSV